MHFTRGAHPKMFLSLAVGSRSMSSSYEAARTSRSSWKLHIPFEHDKDVRVLPVPAEVRISVLEILVASLVLANTLGTVPPMYQLQQSSKAFNTIIYADSWRCETLIKV